MEIDLEERIRQRAYELWEDTGQPEGGAEDFWLQAEGEIKGRMGRTQMPPTDTAAG